MSVYHNLYERWEMSKIAIDGQSYDAIHKQVLSCIVWYEQQGITNGDVICVQLSKSTELLIAILAAFAKGCPILPLNDGYTAAEVQYYLEDTNPTLSILSVTPKRWSKKVFSLETILVISFIRKKNLLIFNCLK